MKSIFLHIKCFYSFLCKKSPYLYIKCKKYKIIDRMCVLCAHIFLFGRKIMAMLNIVIADNDEAFLEALERFLRAYYRERFEMVCITTSKYLNEYIKNASKKIDILLIVPGFFPLRDMENVNTIILMTDGRITAECEKYKTVEKFQTVQKLVRKIIDIYADNNPDEVHVPFIDKKTKVIGVFSPNGGAGKTTMAIAMAMRSVQRGMKVFYLNLESVPSTSAFLDCNSEINLSHVLYFLKEKSKNLSLKVEGASLEYLNGGLNYFAPPDSPYEINEITGDDIRELVNQLKTLNKYDSILIDMCSMIDDRNMKIFEICDNIICILTTERCSQIKATQFLKLFEMAESKELQEIQNKIRFVMNKCDEMCLNAQENFLIEGRLIEARIPNRPEMFSSMGEKQEMSLRNDFGEAVNQLVSSVLGVKESEF